jgi:hypothetical protein
VVTFREDASPKDRLAAVSSAGGSLAGSASSGGEYVRASDTVSTRDLADRLALAPAVASVSERSCPR